MAWPSESAIAPPLFVGVLDRWQPPMKKRSRSDVLREVSMAAKVLAFGRGSGKRRNEKG